MTVVVTGAAGHIGGNLVRALLKQKRSVRAMIKNDTRAIEGLDIEVVQGDVRDVASLIEAFKGAETVFHLAAQISIVGSMGGLVEEINIQGPANVAEACLACGVKRLVHFSSVHAYHQDPNREPLDETWEFSLGKNELAYDRSKALGQRQILAAVERGLDAVILNPTGVIGPHDYKPSRMGQVFLDMAQGKLPSLIEGGFDWVDARDVCQAALAAENQGRTGENYLISGNYATVTQYYELVSELSGEKLPWFTCPQWMARASAPFAEAFAKLFDKEPLFTGESLRALRANTKISHEKAARDLNYQPRPLSESIRDIHDWWIEQGKLEATVPANAKESAVHV